MQCTNIGRATNIEISFPVSSLQEIINSGKLNYVGTATVLGTPGCSFSLKTVNDRTKVTMILSVFLQNNNHKLSFHVVSLVREETAEVDLGTNVNIDRVENPKSKENHISATAMEGNFTPSFESTSVCNIKSEVLEHVPSDNLVIKSEVCQDEPSDNLAIGTNLLEPELAVTQDVPNLQSGVKPKTISANLIMTPSGLTLVPALHPVQMTTPHINPLVQSTSTGLGQTFVAMVSAPQPIQMTTSHNPLVQTAKTYSDQTLVNVLPVSHPAQMTLLSMPLVQTPNTCSAQTHFNLNLLPVSHPGQMTMLNTPLVQTANTCSDQTLVKLIPVSHPVQITSSHTPLVQTAKTCSSQTLVSLEPVSHLDQMKISHSPLVQTAKTTSDQTGNVSLTEKTTSAVPVAVYENMTFNKNVLYPSIKTEPDDSAMSSSVDNERSCVTAASSSVGDDRSCVTAAGITSPKINTSETLEEHNLTGDSISENTPGMPNYHDKTEAKKRRLSDIEEKNIEIVQIAETQLQKETQVNVGKIFEDKYDGNNDDGISKSNNDRNHNNNFASNFDNHDDSNHDNTVDTYDTNDGSITDTEEIGLIDPVTGLMTGPQEEDKNKKGIDDSPDVLENSSQLMETVLKITEEIRLIDPVTGLIAGSQGEDKNEKMTHDSPGVLENSSQLTETDMMDGINRKKPKMILKRKYERSQDNTAEKKEGKKQREDSVIVLRPLPTRLKKGIKVREKKHRPRQVARSKTSRKRKQYLSCSLSVQNMPRHLKDSHDFSKSDAFTYVKKHKLKMKSGTPNKNYSKCPVAGCDCIVEVLSQHLRQIHHMDSKKEIMEVSRSTRKYYSHVPEDAIEQVAIPDNIPTGPQVPMIHNLQWGPRKDLIPIEANISVNAEDLENDPIPLVTMEPPAQTQGRPKQTHGPPKQGPSSVGSMGTLPKKTHIPVRLKRNSHDKPAEKKGWKKQREDCESVLRPLPLPLKEGLRVREKKHRPRRVLRIEASKMSRKRKQCLLCPLSVQRMPRHLKDAHDFSKSDALTYVKKHKLKMKSGTPNKNYFKCPMAGCDCIVQVLSQHLRQIHHMDSKKEIMEVSRSTRKYYSHVSEDAIEQVAIPDNIPMGLQVPMIHNLQWGPRKDLNSMEANISVNAEDLENDPIPLVTVEPQTHGPPKQTHGLPKQTHRQPKRGPSSVGSMGTLPKKTHIPVRWKRNSHDNPAEKKGWKKQREDCESILRPLPLPLKEGLRVREKKHRPRRVLRIETSKMSRKRKQCLLCPLSVQNIPRHLKDAHDFSKSDALTYVKKHKLKMKSGTPNKNYFKCPVAGCDCIVQSLSQHLRQIHNIDSKEEIRDVSSSARKYYCDSSGNAVEQVAVPDNIPSLWVPSINDTDNLENDEDSNDSAEERIPQHNRRSFAQKDAELLLSLCDNLIQDGNITQKAVKNQLKMSNKGTKLCIKYEKLYGANWSKKFADRLRTEERKIKNSGSSKKLKKRRGKKCISKIKKDTQK